MKFFVQLWHLVLVLNMAIGLPLDALSVYLPGKLRADNFLTVFLHLWHLYLVSLSKTWRLYLYYKNLRFPRTIPGFEGGFRGGWGLWPAGVGCGSRVSRLVSACRSRFGRRAAVEGATTTVTFGGEGAVRYW
jgi:hypothetical protein